MVKPSSSSSSTSQDALALFNSLRSAYSATPTALKIIDLYVGFAVSTAIIQAFEAPVAVVYMALVGSFPFNSFLSGVLSCIGTVPLLSCINFLLNFIHKRMMENKRMMDSSIREIERTILLRAREETGSRLRKLLRKGRWLVCEDITGGLEDIAIPASNLVDDPPVALPVDVVNMVILASIKELRLKAAGALFSLICEV